MKKGASGFFGTNLASILISQRVDTVILCGATTSGCVRATAVDLLQYGGQRSFHGSAQETARRPRTRRTSSTCRRSTPTWSPSRRRWSTWRASRNEPGRRLSRDGVGPRSGPVTQRAGHATSRRSRLSRDGVGPRSGPVTLLSTSFFARVAPSSGGHQGEGPFPDGLEGHRCLARSGRGRVVRRAQEDGSGRRFARVAARRGRRRHGRAAGCGTTPTASCPAEASPTLARPSPRDEAAPDRRSGWWSGRRSRGAAGCPRGPAAARVAASHAGAGGATTGAQPGRAGASGPRAGRDRAARSDREAGRRAAASGRQTYPIRWRKSQALGVPHAGSLVDGVRLPVKSRDWVTWDPVLNRVPNRPNRLYGTDTLVRFLVRVIGEYSAAHPKAPRVVVGDLSLRRGGEIDEHVSHENGLDVDVYYPRRDGKALPPQRWPRSTCAWPRISPTASSRPGRRSSSWDFPCRCTDIGAS